MAEIKVYGAPWCPDCRRAKQFLGEQRVAFDALAAVAARDRETGEERAFSPAAAFVFIGLDPNTGFLKGSLELDQWGFVITDDKMQTSLTGVCAAGIGVPSSLYRRLGFDVAPLFAETSPVPLVWTADGWVTGVEVQG